MNVGRAFDIAALGRVGELAPVGLYERASKSAQFTGKQVQTPLVYVAVSGLSGKVRRIEHAETAGDASAGEAASKDYRHAAGLGLSVLLAAVFPAHVLLMVEATPVVRVLLGDQWLEAAPLLVLLSAAMGFQAIGRCVKWIYLAEGRTSQQLRWSYVETAVLVAFILVGLPFETIGVAWALLLASAVTGPGALVACVRGGRLIGRDVLRAVERPALAALLAGVATMASGAVLPLAAGMTFEGALVRLGVQACVFTFVYAGLLLATRGGRGMVLAVVPVRLLPSSLARWLSA